MKLITIQDINVFKQLKQNNVYYSDLSRLNNKSNLIKPYKIMMNHYGYLHVPIFCCVIGRYSEFFGAKIEDGIILELDVPKDIVKLQVYYNWSDIIYFTEYPNEWSGSDINKFIIDTLNGYETDSDKHAIQAVIPYIHPEWLKGSYIISPKFLELYYGSGGNNILDEKVIKRR